MVDLQEQNWINLFGQYESDSPGWFGTWTTYSPEKEVLKTFQGVRCFRANANKTVVTHTNNYTYSDGSTSSKSWTLEKESCSQPDGVIHPALPSMRAIYLSPDATAVVSQKRESDLSLGAELFFYYEDQRTSIIPIYNEQGQLEKIVQIREQWGHFPEHPPTETITQLSGSWRGEKRTITPDLKCSEPEKIEDFSFDQTSDKNKLMSLPDGFFCYPQKSIKLGEPFQIKAGQIVSEQEYKQITVEYDYSGTFVSLIFEVLHRQS
ncbi:DUF3598 family protein [Limnoraphis robusta]|uniref:DUF3598 family protein n=1 Tax=Limnoraphis robusta CCNP1315 TaxID=3110306 RepID=A0ABU5TY29_9CYAN|nr:DUF3598 family protein [Limnoraphis robusta]MEA5519833.1 DUF3598 family protein [Limnoraphis robusta CCNP1315]MEA5547868.1 DUF3598 family protein [Limnoraphis robusta CCNP1324]